MVDFFFVYLLHDPRHPACQRSTHTFCDDFIIRKHVNDQSASETFAFHYWTSDGGATSIREFLSLSYVHQLYITSRRQLIADMNDDRMQIIEILYKKKLMRKCQKKKLRLTVLSINFWSFTALKFFLDWIEFFVLNGALKLRHFNRFWKLRRRHNNIDKFDETCTCNGISYVNLPT